MLRSGLLILIISSISVVGVSNNCKGSINPICSKLDKQGRKINLSGLVDDRHGAGCQCILTFNDSSHASESIAINIEANEPAGCQNAVYFMHNSTTKKYSCSVYRPMYTFKAAVQDNLKIKLVSVEKPSGGFQFCFTISTVEQKLNMHLVCNKPSITGMTTSSTTTEIKPDTEVSKSTQTTTDQITDLTSKDENGDIAQSKLGVIIGGCVGGLTVIIVIIITILCVIRKRRKDKTYESPEAAETEAYPYQNIPDNRSGEITHPYQNIPDNRSGEITHQPKQNYEVVHQENDPYTSIDNDIIKPSNGNQGTEYLGNDLSNNISSDYVVVDDKLKAQLPVVAENAQVNKPNANKTANGKFKTGPRGDKYAVVNKGGKMINNDQQFKIGPSGDQYVVVKQEGNKKKNKEAGNQFKKGPRGDQYAVVNKKGRSTNN